MTNTTARTTHLMERARRLLAIGLVVATVVGGAALVPDGAAGAATLGADLVPSAGRLVGLHVDNASSVPEHTYRNAVDRRELDAGRKLDVLATQPYGFTNTFPTWRERWMATTGHVPLVDWAPGYSPAVVAGHKDAVIDARAAGLKAFGSRVFLRYGSIPDKADRAQTVDAASFAAAYRRVRARFDAAGATNVVFVWCPSTDAWSAGTARSWYPGDAAVDWTCADGRNSNAPWTGWAQLFRPFVAAAPADKPQLAVFGSVEGTTGQKATWIEWAFGTMGKEMPSIKAAIYDDRGPSSLTTSTAARDAFNAAVKNPAHHRPTPVVLPAGRLVPASGAYVGLYRQADVRSEELADLDAQEAALGRKLDIAHHFYGWGDAFPTWRESTDLAAGRMPLVSWGGVSTTQVAAGQHDELIRTRARAVKGLTGTVFLRWFWEMDGGANAGKAVSGPAYVSAWNHIRSIFAAEGATNVAWVWSPNAWGIESGAAQWFYPGDAAVDWIAADAYNFAPLRTGEPWRSFTNLFAAWYSWAGARNKPLMIAETGGLERNAGEKAQWLRDMGTSLAVQMPKVRALVYFNEPATSYTDGATVFPWNADTTTASATAFTTALNLPHLRAER